MKNTYIIGLIFLFGCNQYPKTETYFYEDGTLKTEYTVFNSGGKRETKNFHKDGWLHFINSHENHDGSGETILYDSTGNTIEVAELLSSERHGKFREYYSTGELKVEGEFEFGQPHGIGHEYYENGGLFRKYVYRKGKMIYLKQYDKDSSVFNNILSILVEPKIDNAKKYMVGDSIDIKIRLEYSDYEKIGLIIGPLDSLRQLIPELSSQYYFSDSLEFTYPFPITNIGKNTISGLIEEYKYSEIIEDTLYQVKGGAFPFDRTFKID